MNYSEHYKKILVPPEDNMIVKNTPIIKAESIYNEKNETPFQERMEKLVLLKKALFDSSLEIQEDFNILKFNTLFDVLKSSILAIYINEKLESTLNIIKPDSEEQVFSSDSSLKSFPKATYFHNRPNQLVTTLYDNLNLVILLDIYCDFIFIFIYTFSSNLKEIRRLSLKDQENEEESSRSTGKVDYYHYFCEHSNFKELVEQAIFIRKSLVQFVVEKMVIDPFIEYNLKKVLDMFSHIINVELIYMYKIDFFVSFIKYEILDYTEYWFNLQTRVEEDEIPVDNNKLVLQPTSSSFSSNKINTGKSSNCKDIKNKFQPLSTKAAQPKTTTNKSKPVQTPKAKFGNCKTPQSAAQSNVARRQRSPCKVHIISNVIASVSMNKEYQRSKVNIAKQPEKPKSLKDLRLGNEIKCMYVCLMFDINEFLFTIKNFEMAEKFAEKAVEYYSQNLKSGTIEGLPLNTETKLYITDKFYQGIITVASQYLKLKNLSESQKYLRLLFQTISSVNLQNLNKVATAVILFSKILFEQQKFAESLDKLLMLTCDGPNEYGLKIEYDKIESDLKSQILYWKAKNLHELLRLDEAIDTIEEYLSNLPTKSNSKYTNGLKIKLKILLAIFKRMTEILFKEQDIKASLKQKYMSLYSNEDWIKLSANINNIFIIFSCSKNAFPSLLTNDTSLSYSNYKENADLVIQYCSCLKEQLDLLFYLNSDGGIALKEGNDILSSAIYKSLIPKELLNALSSAIVSSSLVKEKLNDIFEAENTILIGKSILSYGGELEHENWLNIILQLDPNLLFSFLSLTDNLGSLYLSTNQVLKGLSEFENINSLFELMKGHLKDKCDSTYSDGGLERLAKIEFYNTWKTSEAYSQLNNHQSFKIIELSNSMLNHSYWSQVDIQTKTEIVETLCRSYIDMSNFEVVENVVSKEITLIIKQIQEIGKVDEEDFNRPISMITSLAVYFKDKKQKSNLFERLMLIGIRLCEAFPKKLLLSKLEIYLKLGSNFNADDSSTKALHYLKAAETMIYDDSSTKEGLTLENFNVFNDLKKKIVLQLGLTNMSLENFSGAEDYLKTAFDMFSDNIKKQGDCSSAIALCKENLGEISEAIGYYQTTLILREKAYGENSKAYQSVLNKLNMLTLP